MADPFANTVESLAPAPSNTNFFDPAPGASVIARYAGAGRVLDDMDQNARVAHNVLGARLQERDAARKQVTMDREDQDYEDKMVAREALGGVLAGLNAIDHEAPDYAKQMGTVLQNMPRGVLQDEGVRSLLTFKNSLASKAEAGRIQKDTILARGQQKKMDLRAIRESGAAFQGATDADLDSIVDPETGEYVPQTMAQLARKEGELKRANAQQVGDRKHQQQMEKVTLKEASKDDHERADIMLTDTKAFPLHLEGVLQKYSVGKKGKPIPIDATTIEKEHGAEYKAAQTRDRRQRMTEIEAAQAHTMEEYVGKLTDPNATEVEKKKRRDFWAFANAGREVKNPEYVKPTDAQAAAQAAPAAQPTVTPAAQPTVTPAAQPTVSEPMPQTLPSGAGKPLDLDTMKQFMRAAGRDRAKAEQMARDAGWTF